MTRLDTYRDLFITSRMPGLILVKRQPGRKSRIHSGDCRVFRTLANGFTASEGAALEYHYCEDWADAAELWKSVVGGAPRPCSKCRPAP